MHFEIYNRSNLPQLQVNRISCLMESRDGSLWIGTAGHGIIIKKIDGSFLKFQKQQGLTNHLIHRIMEDRRHRVWIVNESGLNIVEEGKIRDVPQINGESMSRLRDVFQDSQGNFWISTYNGDVLRINESRTDRFSPAPNDLGNSTYTFFESSRGIIYLGTSHGIARYKDGKLEYFNIIPNMTTLSITEDKEGNLFAGTCREGLFFIRGTQMIRFNQQDLTHPSIPSLWMDRENTLWIGTLDNGLRHLTPSPTCGCAT